MKKILVIIVMALAYVVNANAELQAYVTDVKYSGISSEQIQVEVTVNLYGVTKEDAGTWRVIVRPVSSGISNLLQQQSKSTTVTVYDNGDCVENVTLIFTCSAYDSTIRQCSSNSFSVDCYKQ